MRKPKILKDYIVITKQGVETLQIATSKREVLKAMNLSPEEIDSIECLGIYYNHKDPDAVFLEAQEYYRDLLKIQSLYLKQGNRSKNLDIINECIERLVLQNEYIVTDPNFRRVLEVC